MTSFEERCEREDEEDRLRPWLAQIRSLNAELAATQAHARKLEETLALAREENR